MYRVASFPGDYCENPYIKLFYKALSFHEVELINIYSFDVAWLVSNINCFDAIHLHWPENLWRNHINGFHRNIRHSGMPGLWRLCTFIEKTFGKQINTSRMKWFENVIMLLKNHGKKIFYTWHNIEPHENVSGFDLIGSEVMASYSDMIIFHSEWAKEHCLSNYKTKAKIVVIKHGNYDEIYPPPRDKPLVLNELGLDPQKPTVGCLGAMRDYKGLDIACEALQQLSKSTQLICAGKPYEKFDLGILEQSVATLRNVAFMPRLITDQEFSDFTNACEIMVLPYKKVTGSGALLAYLTLKRGVVASDLRFFNELLSGHRDAGVLVPPNDPNALALSIRNYLNVATDIRSSAARKLADAYSWPHVVTPVVDCINHNFRY